MIDVLDVISGICAKNKEKGRFPHYADFSDIQNEVTVRLKKEINGLILDKKVKHHETINSFSFEVLDEPTDKQ